MIVGEGFINLAGIKRDLSTRQIVLNLDFDNDTSTTISAANWNEPLDTGPEVTQIQIFFEVTAPHCVEASTHYYYNVPFNTTVDSYLNSGTNKAAFIIHFNYAMDGWFPVALPEALNEAWNRDPDLDDNGIPDIVILDHKTQLQNALAKLSTWKIAENSEVIASISNQQSEVNEPCCNTSTKLPWDEWVPWFYDPSLTELGTEAKI